jgi:hypothetical protein
VSSCYDSATLIAQSEIDCVHPVRLSLAVSISTGFGTCSMSPRRQCVLQMRPLTRLSGVVCNATSLISHDVLSLGPVPSCNRISNFTEHFGEGLSPSDAKEMVLLMGVLRDNLVGFLFTFFARPECITCC